MIITRYRVMCRSHVELDIPNVYQWSDWHDAIGDHFNERADAISWIGQNGQRGIEYSVFIVHTVQPYYTTTDDQEKA